MPPYHFPQEDTLIQTKQWATNTIESLFSDSEPISFEPIKPIETHDQTRPVPTHPPARRSISVLEARVFSRHHDDESESGDTKDSSVSRVRPWTTSFVSDNTSALLTSHNQKSISSRLRRSLILDKPHLNKRMISMKEQDGITKWKNTFLLYLADANMVSMYIFIYKTYV